MKRQTPYRKVILAVDLKADDSKLTKALWETVRNIAPRASIQPVAVLAKEELVFSGSLKSRMKSLHRDAEKHLARHLESRKLIQLARAKVLLSEKNSTSDAVKRLLNYAKSSGAELIAISSHAKTGMDRFFLGSFAETMTLESSIPLLVMNPKQSYPGSNRILYPTDFSEESRRGLERVCESFAGENFEVVLFHSFVFPLQFYASPYLIYPVPQSAFEDELQSRVQEGNGWVKALEEKGYKAKLVVDRKTPLVADAIAQAAKKQRVSLIAMISTTGKWGVALMGSITRQVLRSSIRPVWVVHPPRKMSPTRTANRKVKKPKRSTPPLLRVARL